MKRHTCTVHMVVQATHTRTLCALSSLTAHLFPVEGTVGFLELYFLLQVRSFNDFTFNSSSLIIVLHKVPIILTPKTEQRKLQGNIDSSIRLSPMLALYSYANLVCMLKLFHLNVVSVLCLGTC